MPESLAKKQWMKEHTTFIGLKLTHNTDGDILRWLDKQPSKQGAIRAVLKEHIRREQEQEQAAQEDGKQDKPPEGV